MSTDPVDCPFCRDKNGTIAFQEMQLRQCRAALDYIREIVKVKGLWTPAMERVHVEAVYPYKPGEG